MTSLELDPRGSAADWRPAHWVVPVFALAALVLVPWAVFLVRYLPSTHASAHWDIAWAGFDVALALLLLAVAVAAWHRSPWLEGAAAASAALLAVDAWFDITTSATTVELATAIGEALLIELPLAMLCLLLARDAERVLRPVNESHSEPADPRAAPLLTRPQRAHAPGRPRRVRLARPRPRTP